MQTQLGDDLSTAARQTLATLVGDAKLVIKSNVSPDITISLSDLLNPPPADGTTTPTIISSQDQSKLQWIKPEVELRTLGGSSVYAPFGPPNKSAFIYFSIGLIIAILLGARIAWALCRSVRRS